MVFGCMCIAVAEKPTVRPGHMNEQRVQMQGTHRLGTVVQLARNKIEPGTPLFLWNLE